MNIDVYECYLQFKWPNTEVKFTVGMQPLDFPISGNMFYENPVSGNTWGPAAMVKIPVADFMTVQTGFIRFVDGNPGFEPTTTTLADRLDGYFLALPISLEGFRATPWGLAAVFGRDAASVSKTIKVGASPIINNQTVGNNLLSSVAYFSPTVFMRQAQELYWWVGTALSVTALDPFKFYGDIIYGSGGQSDKGVDRRAGLFFDVGAEYTGLDLLTPQLSFWYSTGEDNSQGNGSERMPTFVDNWGPSNSFLFNNQQAFGAGHMGVNPIGSWGLAASLDKITFIKDLKHRITFTYAGGTNSPSALRQANIINGVGNYVQLGRDLTTKENLYAINFDTQYDVYENLAAILETGWAHGDFQTSVWTHRFTNVARNGDAWKVAVGLQYKF